MVTWSWVRWKHSPVVEEFQLVCDVGVGYPASRMKSGRENTVLLIHKMSEEGIWHLTLSGFIGSHCIWISLTHIQAISNSTMKTMDMSKGEAISVFVMSLREGWQTDFPPSYQWGDRGLLKTSDSHRDCTDVHTLSQAFWCYPVLVSGWIRIPFEKYNHPFNSQASYFVAKRRLQTWTWATVLLFVNNRLKLLRRQASGL